MFSVLIDIVICRDPTLQEMKLLICMGIIGFDLLKEVTAPGRKNLFMTVPSAFVLQLSTISLLLRNSQRSTRANTEETEEIVGKTVNFVHCWLLNCRFHSYKWPAFIQVFIIFNVVLYLFTACKK